MAVQQWSDSVLLADLADDPQFTDDMHQLIEQCTASKQHNVLLDMAGVNYLNSSNIAKLLKLRKLVCVTNERRLKLCKINRQAWSVFLVTGLDRIFEVAEDVPTGLAALQIS